MVPIMNLEEEVRLLAQREGPENVLRKIARATLHVYGAIELSF
ncbi:hypothetical protein [Thermofilum sp.]|jgi:hypothetical protein|nr:hypothetical protein [Thermofilum sp.]